MKTRKEYLKRQRLIGVILVIVGIVSMFIDGDITAALFLVPLGICVMCSKFVPELDNPFKTIEKEDEEEF